MDFPGQTRRVISFKRMALTDYTIDIPRLAKKAVLKKALEEAGAWHCRALCVAGRGAAGGECVWQCRCMLQLCAAVLQLV